MADYQALAKEARREVLKLVFDAQTSHIASNFSVIDIATVLYENLKPEDRVVWSKGWAAATIYYFLAKKGIISYEDLKKFPNEPYLGLAEPSVRGVEVSGGAMGHGLPVAVGMALGKKRSGDGGVIYCIMSDGEMQEGTTWESAAIAAHNKLDNLVVLIDVNKWCAMGKTSEVCDMEPLDKKWEAFRWSSGRGDGHDYIGISFSIAAARASRMPHVIVFDTIKGKGVSFMENHLLYHYKQIDQQEYEKALAELA